MKREFVMLAQKFDPIKHRISGWYASEKLDGIRAFWDGGISRGKNCSEIPYANIEKDARYIVQPKATGLWSRYCKPIQAPAWWLDKLPLIPLAGELWMNRGMFQSLTSTVKQLNPDERWRDVKFMAFDKPPYRVIFGNAEISTTNLKKSWTDVLNKMKITEDYSQPIDFHNITTNILPCFKENEVFKILAQTMLPMGNEALAYAEKLAEGIIERGGEGLMLRHPTSFWVPQRSHQLLKMKPYSDAEAEVVGYVWGRETDKGSKLLGKMGALIVEWNGLQFELSGFTDQEREMISFPVDGFQRSRAAAMAEGTFHPGEIVKAEFVNPNFRIGDKVTFKYR